MTRPPEFRRPALTFWISLALLALALAMRVDWHIAFARLSIYLSPAVDEALHWSWAQDLAAGRGSPEIPYFRAPLYPWWLGFLHWTGLGLEGLRWAGTLLGMLNLLFLAHVAGRWLGSGTRLVLLALIGTSAAWIYYEPQLLIEPFLLLWLITATWSWQNAQEHAPGWADACFGFSLGLASISRPNALLLAPLAVVLIFLLKETPARRLRRTALWTTAWLVPVLLVAWINGWPGSGVFIASQGGVNFWIGNHPGADGTSAALPESGHAWERADAAELAARELGHPVDPAAESAFYFDRAWQWMRGEPADAAALMLRKTAWLLAPVELGNNTSPHVLADRRPWMGMLLWCSWWLVLWPGLAGLALGYPRHDGLRRWVGGAFLLYAFSIVLFFVNGRFRLALLPLLALPAADFLAHGARAACSLWHRRQEGQSDFEQVGFPHRRSPTRLTLAALLLVLPLLAWQSRRQELGPAWRDNQAGWQAFQLGNAWLRLDEPDSARIAFIEALDTAPGLPEVRLNLGLLEMRRHPARAESLFRAELVVDPRSAKSWNNLGTLYLQEGNPAEAVQAFQSAIFLRPGLGDAAWNLGLAHARRGLDALAVGDSLTARSARDAILATPYRGRGLDLLRSRLGHP